MKILTSNGEERPVTDEKDNYPALRDLIGGYFHQDYDIISDDVDEVVEAFKKESWDDDRKNVVADIQHFLEKHNEEDPQLGRSVEAVFAPGHSFYVDKFRTTREALLKIVEILSGNE